MYMQQNNRQTLGTANSKSRVLSSLVATLNNLYSQWKHHDQYVLVTGGPRTADRDQGSDNWPGLGPRNTQVRLKVVVTVSVVQS